MQNKFTFIDLFSGIGGFHIALKNLGGTCIGYSEINKQAVEVYCNNLDMKTEDNLGDITKIKEIPQCDILTAGVPCQSWSIAGNKLGFDDDRGQLWNDTIYLLNQSQPKAFIFENVKGLADPRNRESFKYILDRIKNAGYYANFFILNSQDYGVLQNRERVYIIGFKNKTFFDNFTSPALIENKKTLNELFSLNTLKPLVCDKEENKNNFSSLSSTAGYNDYFLFNDLRGGETTIHSWDIIKTTKKEKEICLFLMKNRRKKKYGNFDGNPLSLKHFKEYDEKIREEDLEQLIEKGILKSINYIFEILPYSHIEINEDEKVILELFQYPFLFLSDIKSSKEIKKRKINANKILEEMKRKGILKVYEKRFDFKNSKISTGLFGINRIFLPSSKTFSTLVASDTHDYISTVDINRSKTFKQDFIKEVFYSKNYRQISKKEACLLQGFPSDYTLPEKRNNWMRLIGNSVSIPVIQKLLNEIIITNIFK